MTDKEFIDRFNEARNKMNETFESYMDGVLSQRETKHRILDEMLRFVSEVAPTLK